MSIKLLLFVVAPILYLVYECIRWVYYKTGGGIKPKDIHSVHDIVDFLKQEGERLEPLSVREVEQLQSNCGMELPLAYKQFLFTMGKGAGRFMLGSDVFYEELAGMSIGVADLVEENELPPLPEDAFVFWMHQGYRFAFFRTSEGDDPPVYYYTEDDEDQKDYVKYAERLTDFFLIKLKDAFPEEDIPVTLPPKRPIGSNKITIEDIVSFLHRKGEWLKPLDLSHVKKIETTFKVTLPETYKHFLLAMGKDAGRFMLGTSAFYKEIFGLKEGVEDLRMEHDLPPLPEDAFVFWMHQGYQFAFFRTSEGDDPPVYYFTEGRDQKDYVRSSARLTDFFLIELKQSFPEDDIPLPL